MNYKVNWDCSDGVFAVPNAVCDDCLKLASGKALKILLYLIKNNRLPEEKELDLSKEDIEDAVSYWKQVGVIRAEGEAVTQTAVTEEKTAEKKEKPEKVHKRILSSMKPVEFARRMAEDAEISFLFNGTMDCLCRPSLNTTEQASLLLMHDYYGLSADVILMLMAFCVSINRTDWSYIETIAADWSKRCINTHEAAESEIMELEKFFTKEHTIAEALGIANRTLIKDETECIEKWARLDIPIPMIMLAYEKTIKGIQTFSPKYMDKMLIRWHDNALVTPEAAEEFDARSKPADAKPKDKLTKNSGKTVTVSSDIASGTSFDLGLLFEHAKNNAPKLSAASAANGRNDK